MAMAAVKPPTCRRRISAAFSQSCVPHGPRLVVVARRRGYSNHAIGSTRLDLAVIADLDRDGGAEIMLPDQRRTRLAVVSLVDGALIERWRGESGPAIGGSLTIETQPAGWVARYLTPDDG